MIKSEDDPYWLDLSQRSRYLKKVLLKRLKTYDNVLLSYDIMKANGLKSTIQGPITLNGELRNYLVSVDNDI